MTMDDPVRRALADLAEADASRHAPPHLERAVLDAFDRQREQGYFQRCAATAWAYRREAVAVAVAASVTTTIYLKVLDRVVVQPPVLEEHRPVQSEVDQTLPVWGESDDIVHSVHVRLPRTMLPLLGVPIIEPDAAGTVNVELLLGHDGMARTIRIGP